MCSFGWDVAVRAPSRPFLWFCGLYLLWFAFRIVGFVDCLAWSRVFFGLWVAYDSRNFSLCGV